MSLKRIRRRLSQTFRFSIEGSLSELAEHLTIEDGAEIKENGVHVLPSFSEFSRKLSASHSRIQESNNRGELYSSGNSNDPASFRKGTSAFSLLRIGFLSLLN